MGRWSVGAGLCPRPTFRERAEPLPYEMCRVGVSPTMIDSVGRRPTLHVSGGQVPFALNSRLPWRGTWPFCIGGFTLYIDSRIPESGFRIP